MYRAYSNKEAWEADRKAVTAGVKMRELMERAGEALAQKVTLAMDRLQLTEVLFVLGSGNNAGDGFVAARILTEQPRLVKVLCLTEKLSPESALVKIRYKGEIFTRIPKKKFPLIVDCVFGTGLKRPPEGEYAKLISWINAQGSYVISCDLPSGLAENGIAFSPCVYADETVSIGCMKNSLLLNEGADHAGKITVTNIGVDYGKKGGVEVWEDCDVGVFFPKKHSNVNKGLFGKSCIVTSGARMGAAMLAASASLRSGAGYTTLRVPERLCVSAATALPSCIVEDFNALDDGMLASDALAIGMGSGVSTGLYSIITQLLNGYRGTLILDADALTVLAEFGLKPLERKSCEVILTPHPKEFARLSNQSVKEVLENAVPIAQKFASQYGVTLIFKNNRTIITNGVRTAINNTGSPALAKGGSGDILTGFLVGTCARGLSPFDAACVSCYVFGRAGEFAEEEFGQYAPTASDVIEFLPRAIRSVTEI